MKKITILLLVGILNIGCQAQDKKKEDNLLQNKDSIAQMIERPKGSWKVNRDYDENGNLIGYDSIYTWSSDNLENISPKDRDSTLQSMESRFYSQYSQFGNQGFNDLFAPDSLFAKSFFDEDFFTSKFGEDFMDIERIRERMEARQKEFLKKYRSE